MSGTQQQELFPDTEFNEIEEDNKCREIANNYLLLKQHVMELERQRTWLQLQYLQHVENVFNNRLRYIRRNKAELLQKLSSMQPTAVTASSSSSQTITSNTTKSDEADDSFLDSLFENFSDDKTDENVNPQVLFSTTAVNTANKRPREDVVSFTQQAQKRKLSKTLGGSSSS